VDNYLFGHEGRSPTHGPVQGSRRQEYWAGHARGPRAQQAGKLETRALFAASQGGTVAPAGGNTCTPRSVRCDLKAAAVPLAAAPRTRTPGTCRRFRGILSLL
jgi:hypothetical protein